MRNQFRSAKLGDLLYRWERLQALNQGSFSNAIIARMKRDQQLVSQFLLALNQQYGSLLEVVRWPDEENRQTPAVEAVASDPNGDTVAIEHTIIQPFEGERIDSNRFMKVFGPLEGCPDLMKPGYNVDIVVKVGAIATGVNWGAAAEAVREHLRRAIPSLGEVDKLEPISGLPFALTVRLMIQAHGPTEDDHVWVSRSDIPASLRQVVRTALMRKLPKLLAQNANRRILLLEQADVAHGHSDIRIAIDDLSSEFPGLKQAEEIWLAVTTCWEREGVVFFYELWPNVMGRKLQIRSERM
jgi:hypothetical protein